jgi:hypothetical protein
VVGGGGGEDDGGDSDGDGDGDGDGDSVQDCAVPRCLVSPTHVPAGQAMHVLNDSYVVQLQKTSLGLSILHVPLSGCQCLPAGQRVRQTGGGGAEGGTEG